MNHAQEPLAQANRHIAGKGNCHHGSDEQMFGAK
jgi:hypothetical protein